MQDSSDLFPFGRIPVAGAHAQDLETAAVAALAGGAAVRAIYDDPLASHSEADPRAPVTAADRASHQVIDEILRDRCPADPILSEEASASDLRSSDSRLWVVDPLDGTKEFIARNGEFSVMVGLSIGGRAALGAVFCPASGILYLGIADVSAWRVEEIGAEPTVAELAVEPRQAAGLRFIQSRSHPDERLTRVAEAISPSEIVLSGSVGVKCALIAEGRADLYVHPVPYLKEWDTCAPEAVLRGAGGKVTDCVGGELGYGKPHPTQPRGMFAAPPDVWDRSAEHVFAVGRSL